VIETVQDDNQGEFEAVVNKLIEDGYKIISSTTLIKRWEYHTDQVIWCAILEKQEDLSIHPDSAWKKMITGNTGGGYQPKPANDDPKPSPPKSE